GVVAAGRADAEGVVVPLGGRLLPLTPPARRAGWHRPRLNRTAIRGAGRNPRPAEEAKPGMVEIVAVEIVDVHAEGCARRHERIDDLILEEHRDVVAAHLVAIVATERALAGDRVILFADAGLHHQQRIVEHVGAENDERRRLLVFFAAAGIDIANGFHLFALPVVNQLFHVGMRAQLEAVVRQQNRQDAGLRRGFGIGLTTEPLAMAAVFAGAERYAFGVGIGVAHVGGRRPEWMIAEFPRRLFHDGAGHAHGQRLIGILVLPRSFEHIAAIDLLPAQVAGLTGNTEQLFKAIVIGLQFVVGDRKVFNGHLSRNRVLAVTILDMAAQLVVGWQQPPGDAVPVRPSAADTGAWQKRAEAADWQRGLARRVAQRNGLELGVLEQLLAHRI